MRVLNLADQLNCTNQRKGITFLSLSDEEFLSYSNLIKYSHVVLKKIQDRGLKPGDKVIFQIQNAKDFLIIFWACILGGIIPVPVSVGIVYGSNEKLFNIWNNLSEAYLITNDDALENFNKYKDKNLLNINFDELRSNVILLSDLNYNNDISVKAEIYNSQPDDIAFIQYSSGSTGNPKGVVLTHENLTTNINSILTGAKITSNDSALSWLPLTHDMGLIGFHLASVFADINQYYMPPELFIRRPMLWLAKACEKKVTILFCPNFGLKHFISTFDEKSFGSQDLSNVKLIFNGAEPISLNLCNDFLTKMSKYSLKKTAMFPVYGLAEASLAVTFPPINEEVKAVFVDRNLLNSGEKIKFFSNEYVDNAVSFIDLGYPLDDIELKIVNQSGTEAEEEVIGNIFIKGKNVTRGYYNNIDATNSTINKEGWLNTGDLGFIKNGRLIVTGRSKDVIFLNGNSYFPHDIERVLEKIINCKKDAIVASGFYNSDIHEDELIVFVLYKKDDLNEFCDLLIKVQGHLNITLMLNAKFIIPIKTIPKTTSGKIQRYKLINLFKNGEYNAVIEKLNELIDMKNHKNKLLNIPQGDMNDNVINIIKDILGINYFGINDNLFEYGISSIKLAQIHDKLEVLFPGLINISDYYKYPTISKLLSYIKQNEKIRLDFIELPLDYFFPLTNENSKVYEYCFNDELCQKLQFISSNENIPLNIILLSMYIFLFHELLTKNKLSIQVLDFNKIFQINIDFNEISDFFSLFNTIRGKISNDMDSYSINTIKDFNCFKDEKAVLPLLIFNNGLNINLMDYFDMVLEIVEDNDKLQFIFEYNSNKLNNGKIHELFNNYIKLIKLFINRYDLSMEEIKR